MAGETVTINSGDLNVVVAFAKVEDQWAILQTVLKYGLGGFVARAAQLEGNPAQVKAAIMGAVTQMVVHMPYAEQTALIDKALSNAFVTDGGESQKVIRSMFSGKMPEYLALGVKAVKHQLGDFSAFLSLMPDSTAAAVQE